MNSMGLPNGIKQEEDEEEIYVDEIEPLDEDEDDSDQYNR